MARPLRMFSAVLWTLVILVLCWTPSYLLPLDEGPGRSLLGLLHLDKVVHAGIFVAFTVLWLRAVRGGNSLAFWVFAGGLALAVITEWAQNLPLIAREGEAADAVVDVIGLLAGFPIYVWLEKLLPASWRSREVMAVPAVLKES